MIDLSLYGVISSTLGDKNPQLDNIISTNDIYPDKYEYEYPRLILDQSQSKMCVACSIAVMRYIQYYKSTGISNIFPDPVSIYANRSIPEDADTEGMSAKDTLYILQNKEILAMDISNKMLFNMLYNTYTYKDSVEYLKANKARLTDIFKIESFYLLHSINDIKWSIMNFYAVTATIPMYMCYRYPSEMKTSNGIEYYANFDADYARMEAGYLHQVTIVGWYRNYWKVVNSYGEKFGNKGITYLPMEYPITEAWVCIDKLDDNVFGII